MRPRELTLRGFRSYAEETTFEFGDRTLIGIVGPIGSGKSSILDAVAFALYGKTPRIAADTKSLINQRRDALHVSLTFDVDGVRWKAVRSLRRGGASAHALYRLDGDSFGEVADKAREVNEQIESILGMDFDAFRRSVLLAQNQFAGFLEATGTERNKVLKGVFGFERLDVMRDAVKARLDLLGVKLQHLVERRASAEADRKTLATRQGELTAAEERAATLGALRVAVSQADDVIREAEARTTSLTKELAALDALADQVPTREATAGIFTEVVEAAAAMAEAEATAVQAEAAATSAATALERALEDVGGREALERAADLVASLRAAASARDRDRKEVDEAGRLLAAAEAGLTTAATAVAEATLSAEAARGAVADAAAAEEAARGALHAAHQADRAVLLRADLTVGEPCPVCAQMVAVLPGAAVAPEIDAAERCLADAVAAAAAARDADASARAAVAERSVFVAEAERRVAEATRAVTGAAAALADAEQSLTEQWSAATAILGEGDPEVRLKAVRAQVADAEAAERAARTAHTAARQAVDAVRGRREAAAARLARLRSDLANLGGKLGVDVDAGDDAAAIEASLRSLREEWIRLRSAAEEAREQAIRAVAAAGAARTDLLEGAGLAATDDIVDVATEAAKEASGIAAEVRAAEKRLAELDALAADEQQLVASSALLERLHGDLRPSGFLEFVLDERRRTLADLAGVHFETLSAGRYRFSDDADVNIIDLNAADLVRAPASLSGGETFLASLALALALAEIVAREGGRLDAFFLDEGFGSLDPEHLDLAMDGIERLVAGNTERVVVVVSHVPAMRDRVEDLIVLDRDELGNTRVIRGAAAS